MIPILEEVHGCPTTDTACWQKRYLKSDSILAMKKFSKTGDFISSMHDLTSAFDTVKFCVLLEQLSHTGAKEKYWRLIKDWYKNLHTLVHLGATCLNHFLLGEGFAKDQFCPLLFNLMISGSFAG